MARPQKPEAERRTRQIQARFTEDEFRRINEAAARVHLSRSAWIRQKLLEALEAAEDD